MNEFLVCERWRLPVAEQDATGWYLDWVQRQPAGVSRHVTAGFYAYRSLLTRYRPGDLTAAHEYFGGIGAQSLIIRGLLEPKMHSAGEYSPAAAAHLRRALPWLDVQQRDAYARDILYPDLVGLDFGDLTAHRLRVGEPQRGLLDRVMARQPKAVVLTDVAGPHLHLHRERYERVLGRGAAAAYEPYLRALEAWVRGQYGYGLLAGYMDRWSTVMAYVPLRLKPDGILLPTPATPVGLQATRAETPGAGRRNGVS